MTGIPDGANEQVKVTRPKAINREGTPPEPATATVGSPMMHENMRKGAFGTPIKNEYGTQDAGTQSAEKYGLAKGQFGAI
jgi:hypothetical protein